MVGLFGFRRKQIARGLRELTGWDAGSGGATRWRAAGIRADVRPEVLAPAAFAALLARAR